MRTDSHERARLLLDRSLVAEISADERRWLARHTAECAECGFYGELSQRAIQALDGFAFDVDPAAALRVQEAIQRRMAPPPSANQQAGRPIALGALGAAAFLTGAGSSLMWVAAAWLAARWNVPSNAWHLAFAVFWLFPSILFDILLFFRREDLARYFGREGDTI